MDKIIRARRFTFFMQFFTLLLRLLTHLFASIFKYWLLMFNKFQKQIFLRIFYKVMNLGNNICL